MRNLLLLLFLLTASPLLAQDHIRFGPLVGLNMSHYKLDAGIFAFGVSSKPGILAGGIAEIPMKGRLYLQTGAQFVNGGYDLDYFGFNLKATIQAIQVPVNVLFKFGQEENRKFHIGAGPYFAWNIVAKEKITSNGMYTQFGIPADFDSVHNLSKGDFGIGANAGWLFAKKLLVQAYYQKGLASYFLDIQGINVKNYNYGITASYLFGKKEKPLKKHLHKK